MAQTNKLVWSIGVDNKELLKGLKSATKNVEKFSKETSKKDIKIGTKVDTSEIKSIGSSIAKLNGSKINIKGLVDDSDIVSAQSKVAKIDGSKANVKVSVDDSDISSAESRLAQLNGMNVGGGGMGALGKLAGGAAVGGGLWGLISGATNLDTNIRKIKTVYGDSTDTLSQIQKKVVATSKEIGVSTADLSAGIYDALSSGIPNATVFDFVKTASKTAIAGSAELNDVVQVLTGTVNAYAGMNLTAAEASDIFTQAVNVGVFTMPQLVQNMSDITPIASAMRVPLSDASAWLAKLTKNGVPVAKASTMIKSAMSELSTSTSIAGKNFKEASGKTFPAYIKAGGTIEGAMKLMEKQAKKTGVGTQELFGSVEAGAAILGVTGDNAEDFDLVLQSLRDSTGATDEAFQTMNEGSARKLKQLWEDLKNGFNNFLIWLIPWIVRISEGLKKAFKWLMDNKGVIVLALIAIGTAILLAMIPSFVGWALSIWNTVAGLTALNLLMGGIILVIGAIVLAIGLFIAGIVLLYQKNEWFRNFVNETWQKIKEIILQVWNDHLKPALELMKQKWDELVQSVKRLAEEHPELVEQLKLVAKLLGALVIASVLGFFMALAGIVAGVAAGFDAWARAIDAVTMALEGMKLLLDKLPVGVKEKLGINREPLNNGSMGAVFGSGKPKKKPAGSASGGFLPAMSPRIVGERGQEMIFPSRSGYVATAKQTESLLSGGGGSTELNVNVNVDGVTAMTRPQAKEFGSYIIEAVNDDLRKRGVNILGDGFVKSGV